MHGALLRRIQQRLDLEAEISFRKNIALQSAEKSQTLAICQQVLTGVENSPLGNVAEQLERHPFHPLKTNLSNHTTHTRTHTLR